jgi:D-alanine-D-alanine ligase
MAVSTAIIKIANKIFPKVIHPFNLENAGKKTYAEWQFDKGADTIKFFAEKYIEGREINVSILGENGKPLILPPTEIKFVGYKEKHIYEILTYRSKWEEDSFEYKNAVSSGSFEDGDKTLLKNLEDIAEKCWYEFGLKGYARVDFRIDKNGQPWALEINTNPCITPGESSFIKSAIHGGLDYAGVVSKIVLEA